MVAKNEVTGDKLISKVNTKEYEDNYDRIFGKNKSTGTLEMVNKVEGGLCNICGKDLYNVTECAWTSCPKLFSDAWEAIDSAKAGLKRALNDVTPEEWDEVRIDRIGQNSNEGLHYKQDNLPINEYPDNSKEEAS